MLQGLTLLRGNLKFCPTAEVTVSQSLPWSPSSTENLQQCQYHWLAVSGINLATQSQCESYLGYISPAATFSFPKHASPALMTRLLLRTLRVPDWDYSTEPQLT